MGLGSWLLLWLNLAGGPPPAVPLPPCPVLASTVLTPPTATAAVVAMPALDASVLSTAAVGAHVEPVPLLTAKACPC